MKKIFVRFKDALPRNAILALVATTIILALSGCGQYDSSSGDVLTDSQVQITSETTSARVTSPYQEIYDAGLTKYVGASFVQPTSVTTDSLFPRIDVYHYSKSSSERGPLCMSGNEFFVDTRDGWFSDQLLFFLDPGGVCLSEICIATPDTIFSLSFMNLASLIGIGGILNNRDHRNPMANFNVVHVPYCDGSIFTGDTDRPLAYDLFSSTPKMAYQRGLQNLTAAFEVAKKRYPHPSRIVLSGSSGGGYGVVAGVALARYYYPFTEIVMIADSGAPMLRDNNKDFLRRALVDINAIQYIPKSCPDCIANGHLTKLIAWALQRDKNLRVAAMSHTDDVVIGDIYMKSPPPIFRNALVRETASLTNSSNRAHRFITLGRGHTYLLDVLMIDFLMNIVGGISTGIFDFPEDVNLVTLYNESLGALSMTEIDQSGKKVTGYQWIDTFLNNPKNLKDVVNLE